MKTILLSSLVVLAVVFVAPVAILANPIAVAFGTLEASGATSLRLPNPTNASEITFAVPFDGYELSGTICDSNSCGPGFGTTIPQVDLLNFSMACVAVSQCGEIGFHWGETIDTGIPFDPSVAPDVVISSHISGTFFPITTPPPDVIYFGGRVNQGGLNASGEIPPNGFFGFDSFTPGATTSFSEDLGPQPGGPFGTKVSDLVFSMGYDLSPALGNPGDSLTLPKTFINVDLPVTTATPTPEPRTMFLLSLAFVAMAGIRSRRGRVGEKTTKLSTIAVLLAGALTAPISSAQSLPSFFQSLPNLFPLPNGSGFVETYNVNNTSIDLTGPFFQSLGTNGRSCSSCHRPLEAWGISAAEVQARFLLTQGLDPIFRTNDGSNCDHNINTSTVESRSAAYSLLLSRGLIRIALSPPANAQFTVVSVQNPYGCSDTSTLSMYRRPLPSTNLKFLSTVMFDGRESSPQTGTQKITYATNPGDLLADLAHQAVDATTGHAQSATPPTAQQVQDIVNFEMQLRTAQAIDFRAGVLNSDGASGGPVALATQPFFIGINDSFPLSFHFNPFGTPFNPAIFDLYNAWANSQNPARASIARGQAVFNTKPINITGVAGVNDALGLASLNGTCGTCHDSPNVGDHSFPAPLNIGVGDLTSPLDISYLPVITLRNNATSAMVQTTDPGRALITGLWADIGKVKGPILRGLAARAPYFHNGSAASLNDAVTFYDKRFNVGFTDQEKADLVAFLGSL